MCEVWQGAEAMMVAVQGNMLPGPRSMPLLGARGNLIPFMRNPIRFMDNLYQKYGEVVAVARGNTKYVFTFTPKYNQQVLSNNVVFQNLDSSSSPLRIPRDSSLSRLFAGLTQMNGARHRQQRRLMLPGLHSKRLEVYASDVAAVTEKKLDSWQAGEKRDLFREMRELTLSVAVKTLVGLDPDQGGDQMCCLLDNWMNLVFSLPSLLLPFDLPGFSYHRLIALSEELEGFIRSLIERKRASGLEGKDVLSVLMQVHDDDDGRLSDDELVGQTNFLFMAGHATTASALTWTIFLLTQHPATFQDLLDECEGELHGDVPTIEDLERLPLMESVIKETMRLLPPVLWWARISTEPFNLGKYQLPEGALVINSAYMTHRIEDHYPQPGKFLPKRWLSINPGPFEYLPFSAGPRMCLGSAFAMTEIKLVLAILLQRFRPTLPAKTRIDIGGMMLSAPKGGMTVLIEAQDRKLFRSEVRGNIRSVVDLN